MPDNALEFQPNTQLAQYQEQNVSMVQQYATARIQSAYSVALARPRDIDAVRQNVLRECKRPSFCSPDESKNGSSLAIYRVPRAGTNIQGPTIRFAEMMLREWKYLSVEVNPLGENDKERLLQVVCTDYQSCNFTSEMVTVPKSVERKKIRSSDTVLSQRTNTYGEPVYVVLATDDELAMRTNALVSKARRNLILQAVPGWLIEEAIDQVRETARTKDAQDPDAAKRKLFDAFATVGVSATQLAEYLGHANALSPAELEDLRGYFSGIREGYTTWAAIIAAKEEGKEDDGAGAAIDDAFKTLEMTPAQIRKIKGKYAGNPSELMKWLTGEVAKKQNNGGKKEPEPQKSEPSTPNPTTTAPASSPAGPAPTATVVDENLDTEPADTSEADAAADLLATHKAQQGVQKAKQDLKPSPAPVSKPVPPPVEDDDW